MAYDVQNLQSDTSVERYERCFEGPAVEGTPPGEVAELILWRQGAISASNLAYQPTDDRHQVDERSKVKDLSSEEKRIREAQAKLVQLRQAIRSVTSRIKYLDPKLYAAASNGEVRAYFDQMMKQLGQLNTEVKRNPNKFESIILTRHIELLRTIKALHGKLNELEKQAANRVG